MSQIFWCKHYTVWHDQPQVWPEQTAFAAVLLASPHIGQTCSGPNTHALLVVWQDQGPRGLQVAPHHSAKLVTKPM